VGKGSIELLVIIRKGPNFGMQRDSKIQYLGHRNIQHTVRYTELSPTRFKDFWRE
jgi:hypothetical protein